MQFLQLSVTVPSLSEHGLNLLSQSFDPGWTPYPPRLRFYRAYFSLEPQDFFLVQNKLLAKVFGQLSVLVSYLAVGDF